MASATNGNLAGVPISVGKITGSRCVRGRISLFVWLAPDMTLAQGDQVAFENQPSQEPSTEVVWIAQSGRIVPRASGQAIVEIGLSPNTRLIPSGQPVLKLSGQTS